MFKNICSIRETLLYNMPEKASVQLSILCSFILNPCTHMCKYRFEYTHTFTYYYKNGKNKIRLPKNVSI